MNEKMTTIFYVKQREKCSVHIWITRIYTVSHSEQFYASYEIQIYFNV